LEPPFFLSAFFPDFLAALRVGALFTAFLAAAFFAFFVEPFS
jgi:hypothetical protein